jgi:hypothetical protein
MIIGITGTKRSGKDTIAKHLVDNYEFIRVGFADILKEAVANLFNMPLNYVEGLKENSEIEVTYQSPDYLGFSFSGREFLQRFGTEMGRNTFGENFWVEQWESSLYRNSIQNDFIVVPDVRFKNEASRIHTLEGQIIRVNRFGYESDGHESENPLPSIYVDYSVSNDGTIEELYEKIDRIMDSMIGDR